MDIKTKIEIDNSWKELVKKIVDDSNDFNDFQKEILKLLCDIQHENNKRKMQKDCNNEILLEELLNKKVEL